MRRVTVGGLLGTALRWGLAVAMAAPAAAQGIPMPGQNGFQPIVKPDQGTPATRQAAPAALPGARPGRGAIPPDKSVADMAPNDALFDAINRGDLAEARDAVNRGADIRAVNVLGMTPLELSVDLSRNDITFFLLSMRGASGGAVSPKAVAATADAPALLPAGKAAATKAAGTKPAAARATRVAAKAPKATATATGAQAFAASSADPGQPDPQAGFLGFGGTGR